MKMISYVMMHGIMFLLKYPRGKYDKVTIKKSAAEHHHMLNQKNLLLQQILKKYEILFDGKLSHFSDKEFHINLVKELYQHSKRCTTYNFKVNPCLRMNTEHDNGWSPQIM